MQEFLESTTHIDWRHPKILFLARQLAGQERDDCLVAQACYTWVRDTIRHTGDYQQDVITCKASSVLKEGTGYCYAKSHLLAALLRASNIAAGLCYQRVRLGATDADGFCLHGLTAVHLKVHGWHRLDVRGNHEGLDAQFGLPEEQLLYLPGDARLNRDMPEIWPEPLPIVVEALTRHDSREALEAHWPDVVMLPVRD